MNLPCMFGEMPWDVRRDGSEDEMANELLEQQIGMCPLIGCARRNWHRGDCCATPDVDPAKRVSCCQHYSYSSATILEVKFCLCRDCGHRWQEYPLAVAWI